MSHLNFATMIQQPQDSLAFASHFQPAPAAQNHGDDWALVHLLLDSAAHTESANEYAHHQPQEEFQPSAYTQHALENKNFLSEVDNMNPITSVFDQDIVSSQRPFLKHPNSFILPELLHQQQLQSLQALAGVTPIPSLFLSTPSPQTPFDSRKISPSNKKDKLCAFIGCGKLARSRGLCMKHGGGRRCEIPGCNKGSQSGGRCIAHGGGKRCTIDDCQNSQQSDGLCITHGGGKRCTYQGCSKSSQRRGLCYVHGGGQKCQILGCAKGAQRSGLCVEHGGRRYCRADNCQKTARGGGYCIAHGGDTRCQEADCNKIAKETGLCVHHRNLRDGLTPRSCVPYTPQTPYSSDSQYTPQTPHTPYTPQASYSP